MSTAKEPSPFHDTISGLVAGSCGVICGHPLDTIKVQLQIQQAGNKYKSLLECTSTVMKQNWSTGCFRGLLWPMMSAGLINSVFFGVYGFTLNWLGGDKHKEHKVPPYMKIAIAGGVGGVVQLIPAVPTEVIKVVLQSQIPHGNMNNSVAGNKFYSGPVEGVKDILKLRGVSGLYKGTPTQCLRDVPASILYFLSFEFLTYEGATKFPSIPSTMLNFLSGGVAGVLSWSIIVPFDVIKSKLQADTRGKYYDGFWDCALKCYQEDGVKAFFRGFTMVALRAATVNAVIFMVHAECMELLGSRTSYVK